MEGIPEEKGDEAVGPSVGAEDVEDAKARTAKPDGGEELELEAGLGLKATPKTPIGIAIVTLPGLAVKVALNVVLEHDFGELLPPIIWLEVAKHEEAP